MLPKLKEFLDKQRIKYHLITHSPAFTAQEIAAAAHISGKLFAKIIVVKIDGKFAMVVLPANDKISLANLRELTGAQNIDLANESEFKNKFPGCEVGAMPPFGNLFNMPVFISESLGHHDQILFNAGSHSEIIEMSYHDFEKLANPKIVAC